MYSLDVNFLKDRKLDESSKVTASAKRLEPISWRKQTPLFIGLGVGAALLALTALLGTMLGLQKAKTEENIKQLEAEINQINAQAQRVQEMEARVKAIDEEATALVTVFNQIKPWSAILQEIRRRTPPTVQIISIEETTLEPKPEEGDAQPRVQIKINGYGRSYDDVNNFLLTLQNSELFKASRTRIESAKKDTFPLVIDETARSNFEKQKIKVDFPKPVLYTIITELSNIPASKLLPTLSRDGAVGLVTRIKTLEQKGAVQP
jgi:type IV pilus assembly protein PilN